MIEDIAAMIASATRGTGRYWIVSQVGTGAQAGKVKLKRTSTGAETRWIPYAAGLTLAANDRVLLDGPDLNTSVVVTKL